MNDLNLIYKLSKIDDNTGRSKLILTSQDATEFSIKCMIWPELRAQKMSEGGSPKCKPVNHLSDTATIERVSGDIKKDPNDSTQFIVTYNNKQYTMTKNIYCQLETVGESLGGIYAPRNAEGNPILKEAKHFSVDEAPPKDWILVDNP